MGISDHLTYLLRNLTAGQEATVRTRHRTMGWFKIRKGVRQGYILSPGSFNLYAEYIIRNSGLEEAQAGIKIAGRNIDSLRYADACMLCRFSCAQLCNPMDLSPPGSSVHKILQAKILEWVAISFSKGSSCPRNQSLVSYISCVGRRVLTTNTI